MHETDRYDVTANATITQLMLSYSIACGCNRFLDNCQEAFEQTGKRDNNCLLYTSEAADD